MDRKLKEHTELITIECLIKYDYKYYDKLYDWLEENFSEELFKFRTELTRPFSLHFNNRNNYGNSTETELDYADRIIYMSVNRFRDYIFGITRVGR